MYEFFNGVKTVEEAKALFKKLVKENHPDRGGDNAKMARINAEYERLMEKGFRVSQEASKFYMSVIEKIIEFNITIEEIGTWIWVSGNTFSCKGVLKEIGFIWHGSKKMWYLPDPFTVKPMKKSKATIEAIRDKYGSRTIKEAEEMKALQ